MNTISRQQIATFIALAFHIPGFIAIAFFKSQLFISLTPLNLVVCMALIFWTQQIINTAFLFFCLLSFSIGFIAEYIGINTGLLFGKYKYGDVLGPKWNGVPWVIGVQWMITTYCIGICMNMIHKKFSVVKAPEADATQIEQKAAVQNSKNWILLSTIIDGSLLAVFFDWVIEPVAVKLGYWRWSDNEIPMSNYYSWWLVSVPILAAFYYLPFPKQNIFALHLLLIQFMFFLLLNTFG
jgi:putative membrane protein